MSREVINFAVFAVSAVTRRLTPIIFIQWLSLAHEFPFLECFERASMLRTMKMDRKKERKSHLENVFSMVRRVINRFLRADILNKWRTAAAEWENELQ
jgi:hypothetical protein